MTNDLGFRSGRSLKRWLQDRSRAVGCCFDSKFSWKKASNGLSLFVIPKRSEESLPARRCMAIARRLAEGLLVDQGFLTSFGMTDQKKKTFFSEAIIDSQSWEEGRRLFAMRSSWQTQTGHLECRWSGVSQRVHYDPPWMLETSGIQSSYLPPIPDFAGHSPFGGASWFQPNRTDRDSE